MAEKYEATLEAIRTIFKDECIIQKDVANGNKYCGVVYVPKKFIKHKAIIIILND